MPHARINRYTVVAHFGQRGPRQQTAIGSRMSVANAVVIGVKQHPEYRMMRDKIGFKSIEYEGFKKPGRMRQMPLGRTGIRH